MVTSCLDAMVCFPLLRTWDSGDAAGRIERIRSRLLGQEAGCDIVVTRFLVKTREIVDVPDLEARRMAASRRNAMEPWGWWFVVCP